MRFFAILFLYVQFCGAATYYIDFDAGSDANDGASTSTPWRTIPGTYDTGGAAYTNATYGSFTTSAKIPAGTILQIKAGTTHDSDYGQIYVQRDYYSELGGNITIRADSSWGTGETARINASGMTVGISALLIQIDGVTVKNLVIDNCTKEGLQAKEHQGSGLGLTNSFYYSLSFSNNGTSYATDAAGAGAGQLSLRWPVGAVVSNCVFNGNQRYINGLLLGDDHKYPTNVTVLSCTSTNHKGDVVGNDAGIGFKSFNSFVTFSNCYSAFNLKGWDNGEAHGDGYPINVKVVACTATRNYQGVNFNTVGYAGYSGAVNFYLINSLSVSNTDKGMRAYAGPFNLYVVHNVFDNNGGGDTVSEGCNFYFTADDQYETNAIVVRAYNNIMRRAGASQMVVPYGIATNQVTLDSDYNSYEQRASELFCRWNFYQAPDKDYSYGVNGPGKASGEWYTEYQTTTTVPYRGTGHYHCDGNSKGTSATDTTLPSFVDASALNYVMTATYSGTDLSGKAWYVSEMGIDRNGRARSGWDMGAYEYVPESAVVGAVVAPGGPKRKGGGL